LQRFDELIISSSAWNLILLAWSCQKPSNHPIVSQKWWSLSPRILGPAWSYRLSEIVKFVTEDIESRNPFWMDLPALSSTIVLPLWTSHRIASPFSARVIVSESDSRTPAKCKPEDRVVIMLRTASIRYQGVHLAECRSCFEQSTLINHWLQPRGDILLCFAGGMSNAKRTFSRGNAPWNAERILGDRYWHVQSPASTVGQ
jgi:hypothetical protein